MERFFCTAAHLLNHGEGEPPKAAPGFVLHAKTMGTSRTVCGLDATAWTKCWEWPFPSTGTDRCSACAAEIGERVRA